MSDQFGKSKKDLLEHYRQEIENIIHECEAEFRSVIDYEALDQKIAKLILCAAIDGIHENEVVNIIYLRMPAYVNYVNYKKTNRRKAA